MTKSSRYFFLFSQIIDANDDLSAMHSKYDQLASKILSPVSSTNAGSVTDENSRADVTSG